MSSRRSDQRKGSLRLRGSSNGRGWQGFRKCSVYSEQPMVVHVCDCGVLYMRSTRVDICNSETAACVRGDWIVLVSLSSLRADDGEVRGVYESGRGNTPTRGNILHDTDMPRIEPGSQRWEASGLTTTPPRPLRHTALAFTIYVHSERGLSYFGSVWAYERPHTGESRGDARRFYKGDSPIITILHWEHKLQTEDRTTNLTTGRMCAGGGICAATTQDFTAETSARVCNSKNRNVKTHKESSIEIL
ncbi:hypothetical protein PR048_001277 [Dryococelus australis]|uniref:Uncharacterized protein n=1 Tax=Dryococelus australis TaxID=614101 RepID=A0ABQ9IH19_9NEOP|nr:hypothetical protein PR048_001277 [Dryococelus australis]